MKALSVIMPARNRADILPETLAALARQSVPISEFEVVLVDDGSVDGTARVARDTRWPFRLVYVRPEPRPELCIARARNRGLCAASGTIALFLDADVLALPDLVAGHRAAHAAARQPRAVIGYTYGYPVLPTDRTPEAMHPPPARCLLERLPELLERDGDRWRDGRERIYTETRDLADHPHPWQIFWGHNVSAPRSLALEAGGFDEEFVGWGVEDLEFAYRLWRRGVSFHVARGACGVHYPHPIGDPTERESQLQRNRRRLIAKHPSPQLELRLWNAMEYARAWECIEPLIQQPECLFPPRRDEQRSWLDRLVAPLLPSGPLLFCGPPELAPPSLRPAAHCFPNASGRRQAKRATAVAPPLGDGNSPATRLTPGTVHGAPTSLPLLGVFTPWEEASFAAAVVWDYWRRLPPPALQGLVQELLRVAGCLVLLAADDAGASGWRTRSLTEAAASPAPPLPLSGCTWKPFREDNFMAWVATKEEPQSPVRAAGTEDLDDSRAIARIGAGSRR